MIAIHDQDGNELDLTSLMLVENLSIKLAWVSDPEELGSRRIPVIVLKAVGCNALTELTVGINAAFWPREFAEALPSLEEIDKEEK